MDNYRHKRKLGRWRIPTKIIFSADDPLDRLKETEEKQIATRNVRRKGYFAEIIEQNRKLRRACTEKPKLRTKIAKRPMDRPRMMREYVVKKVEKCSDVFRRGPNWTVLAMDRDGRWFRRVKKVLKRPNKPK